jgi:hypothetical protein
MAKSRAVMALAVIVIVIVAVFAAYAGLTYPQNILTVPVSFTAGTDSTTVAFEQPALNNEFQVQVTVSNGAALWYAEITTQSYLAWRHTAIEGELQSYTSNWIQLPSGDYNFTFRVFGGGSLDATVTVASKGGFW